jgi:hypothetical protein
MGGTERGGWLWKRNVIVGRSLTMPRIGRLAMVDTFVSIAMHGLRTGRQSIKRRYMKEKTSPPTTFLLQSAAQIALISDCVRGVQNIPGATNRLDRLQKAIREFQKQYPEWENDVAVWIVQKTITRVLQPLLSVQGRITGDGD